jgi:hypothetical protein
MNMASFLACINVLLGIAVMGIPLVALRIIQAIDRNTDAIDHQTNFILAALKKDKGSL